MNAPLRVGEQVRLVTPDNDRLNGAAASVEQLTEWGAFVACAAAGGGHYRALWEEMERLGDGEGEEEEGEGAAVEAAATNGTVLKPVSRAFAGQGAKKKAVETMSSSATGEVCSNCGGVRMIRDGKCLVCLDCGTSAGGCS